MIIYVVIDEGCQECGVRSEKVGAYLTREEAEAVRTARDGWTEGWREGGQTSAEVYEFEVPAA